MRVVDTDTFDRNYPNEKIVSPKLTPEKAQALADRLNVKGDFCHYFVVVPEDYRPFIGFRSVRQEVGSEW